MPPVGDPSPHGSSPLARGLHHLLPSGSRRRRIIPARAGFTSRFLSVGGVLWDHPRSRGVYQAHVDSPMPPPGSSPLARGLLAKSKRWGPPIRIIPARAGFTRLVGFCVPLTWDNPRSRGVYAMLLLGADKTMGSSPLARGLLDTGPQQVGADRIIPARAGFTGGAYPRPGRAGDHPRSRGVYTSPGSPSARRWGSSPLARGLRAPATAPPATPRIIPARAGFTPRGLPSRRSPADHPRSRGVYNHITPPNPRFMGSSPLARGLRTVPVDIDSEERIIPARAGFTGTPP